MVAFSKISLAVTLATGALASPLASHGPLTLFGELTKMPKQWQSHGRAEKSTKVKAQIGLKQSNIKGLQEKLLDISHPDSPNYGKWMSQEEIAAYTAPAAEHVAAVKSWLASAGITDVSQPTNDWLEFTVPVSQLESLLDAEYSWFSYQDGGLENAVPRTTKYSVPKSLHEMIDVVTPTTALYAKLSPHASDKKSNTTPRRSVNKRAGCAGDGTITPSCINSIYDVDWTSYGSQLVATTAMIGLGASHSDYAKFGQSYAPGLKDFQDLSVSGGSNPGTADLEGNLDTQHMGGISMPNPSQFIAVGNANDFSDEIENFALYLNSASSPPSSVSTSYGGEEQDFDATYLDRVCNEFMKAGSRGISVFFSSGDQGVGGNLESNSCDQGFYALWPASCPWITSVGGTQFDNSGDEVVADFYNFNTQVQSPGGGYSWHFSAPSYNSAATSAFANSLDSSYSGYFNPSGRGYPDVALVSVEYQTYINGAVEGALGTSAASPAWAALVGVLNDYRHHEGKPALGFINPLLYSTQAQAALRDVTSGNNFGCGTNGFYAASGWDAASGLGSLDFAKLRAII